MLNEDILAWLDDSEALERAKVAECIELERRERAYRDGRPPLDIKDRTVVLVDDGAATGATMLAAVRCARMLGARTIVVALPVASTDAERMLSGEADEVICIGTPVPFDSVGQWYENFTQTPDEAVTAILALEDGLRSPS